MNFPYSFLDLVTQLSRYEALKKGYNSSIEKVLNFLNEDGTAEIRARAKVQGQSFLDEWLLP